MSTLDLEPIKERRDKAHTEWGPWKAKGDSWDGEGMLCLPRTMALPDHPRVGGGGMMELLPDLPDTVTGIKCKNPFIVQCPTCGD